MIKQPSLPTLIRSAIGMLSVKIIDVTEKHAVKENKEISRLLGELQVRINSAPFAKRTAPVFIEKLKVIMKSMEISCSPDFFVFIGRKYPSIMMELSKDELIMGRIKHVYRVAEISSCFSMESLKTLNQGISDARKRVFEIDQRSEVEHE